MIVKVPIYVELVFPQSQELLGEYVDQLSENFTKILRQSPKVHSTFKENCVNVDPKKKKVLQMAFISKEMALDSLRTSK